MVEVVLAKESALMWTHIEQFNLPSKILVQPGTALRLL